MWIVKGDVIPRTGTTLSYEITRGWRSGYDAMAADGTGYVMSQDCVINSCIANVLIWVYTSSNSY
jgi:hypothetical protein